MRLTRRDFSLTLAAAAAPLLSGPLMPRSARAEGPEGIVRSHGASLIGELKYPADFAHFAYANPAAPKGGLASIAVQTTFDSFNAFIVKGNPAPGLGLLNETLMTSPLDEGSTQYGLLAEWWEHPGDDSWAAYKVRDDARWHDGEPVTAADVVWSFETLVAKGDPFFRFYYKNVTSVTDEGDGVVRFAFDQTGNRELPQIVGQLTILPAHWWRGRDFEASSMEPPLGSGPYRIAAFEASRFVEYARVADYWGAETPVNRGANNFDRLRYEVYLNDDAVFEAFKSGTVDYRAEHSAIKWAEQYGFPAAAAGRVLRREHETEGPKQVQAFAFNLRREKFRDLKVRKAISLAFDFEWTNRTIYFDQYARPRSWFQGTPDLMAEGAPEGAELALLEELRGQVPDEVFGPAWEPSKTDGSGRNRAQIREAASLLADAGYAILDGVLVSPDGAPFEIEFLSAQSAQERVVNPFIRNLEQLGVRASFRVVDAPQYSLRVAQDDKFDWDMIIFGVANSESPGNEQREYWGSASAMNVGARNRGGVADPAVDALIERIVFATTRAELSAASRALDRVLTWNYYMIPQLYTPFDRIAWWDRFGHPEPFPPRDPGFPTFWWWDEAKAAALEAAR